MVRRTAVCAVLAAVALLVGCGGSNSSDGGSGSSFSSSLPGSAMIGSLSAGDQQKLCSELESYESSSAVKSAELKASCGLAGLLAATFAPDQTDAGIQAACKMAYDGCTTSLASAPPAATQCNLSSGTCTATVSELTACLNADIAASASISLPSCASLTAATLKDIASGSGSASQPAQPAACTTVQMKCPDSGML
jgi:hypothetical protein